MKTILIILFTFNLYALDEDLFYPSITSDNDVLINQDEIRDHFYSSNSNHYAFSEVYYLTTKKILDFKDRGFFENEEWIELAVIEFHKFYLKALRKNLGLENTHYSSPWDFVFNLDKASVLERVLLSMNVHVNYDLPLAIRRVANTIPLTDSIQADYFKLNQVFSLLLPELLERLESLSLEFDQVSMIRFPGDEELFLKYLKFNRRESWRTVLMLQRSFLLTPEQKAQLIAGRLKLQVNLLNKSLLRLIPN